MTTGSTRPSRGRLARGLLPVLVLLGLFVMHTVGLHGASGSHAMPAAHGLPVQSAAVHSAAAVGHQHLTAEPAARSVALPAAWPSASLAGDGDLLTMGMACLAVLLLASLLGLPRARLLRGPTWAPTAQRAPQAPAIAGVAPPLLHVLCISRT